MASTHPPRTHRYRAHPGLPDEQIQTEILDDQIGLVEIHGFLSPREMVAIRTAIHAFELRQMYCIVLNVSDVTGTTMLSLRHLVEQMWELRRFGGDLRLLGVSTSLANVLRDVGADRLFTCYRSREDVNQWATRP